MINFILQSEYKGNADAIARQIYLGDPKISSYQNAEWLTKNIRGRDIADTLTITENNKYSIYVYCPSNCLSNSDSVDVSQFQMVYRNDLLALAQCYISLMEKAIDIGCKYIVAYLFTDGYTPSFSAKAAAFVYIKFIEVYGDVIKIDYICKDRHSLDECINSYISVTR